MLDKPAALLFGDGPPFDLGTSLRETLLEEVGGEEALAAQDSKPLPDEALDLAGVPADVHERVGEVAALVDACCDELLDVEHRTACRRLLADVAAGDPVILRRRARAETAGAAIVWIVARANEGLRAQAGGLTATAIGQWFRVSGPSQRAGTLLGALGNPRGRSGGLGTARYLVAAHRSRIIQRWEAYAGLEG